MTLLPLSGVEWALDRLAGDPKFAPSERRRNGSHHKPGGWPSGKVPEGDACA